MGKSTSNSFTSNPPLNAGATYPPLRLLTSPKSKGIVLNLRISNSPQPTGSAAPPLSPVDEIYYDALEEFSNNTTKDVLHDAPEESLDEDGEIFYDALENFEEDFESPPPEKLTLQSPIDPEPGRAKKGLPAPFAPVPNTPLTPPPFTPTTPLSSTTPVTPVFNFTLPPLNTGLSCGNSKATSSRSYGDFLTVPSTTGAPAGSTQLTSSTSRPRQRAVLIGLNYEHDDNPDRRLKYGTQDARRFATTLKKLGYSGENVKVVTDEQGQPFPSSDRLLGWIDWLVRDVSAGDRLFFMFSGHCEPPKIGSPEPYLVAADSIGIPRSTFEERLVAKIPAGAELTIVLDCCNAAGMVKLKYCIKRMQYSSPQQGSLHGLPGVDQKTPAPPSQPAPPTCGKSISSPPASQPSDRRHWSGIFSAPVSLSQPASTTAVTNLFGTPASQSSGRRSRGGISAGQPFKQSTFSPNLAPAPAPNPFPSFLQPSSIIRRSNMQPVVQGPPLFPFGERKAGPVSPAGKVIFWAGTGERQKAFESVGGAKNGVVTHGMCKILDSCLDRTITLGNVWDSVVKAVSKQNDIRQENDAKFKDPTKVAPNLRVQCPELWISQPEPLSSPSQFLEQSVFQKPTA